MVSGSQNGEKCRTVLLVEDNPADVEFVKYAFVDANLKCEFQVANNGELALSMLHDKSFGWIGT